MKVTVKTDIKGWKNVVSGLKRISGKDYKDIVDAETSEILSQSSNRKGTKIADKTRLVGNEYPVDLIFIGYRGNKKAYTVKAGNAGLSKTTTFYLEHRLPNMVWDYIKTKTHDRTKEAFGNVGLNKGQFQYIHQLLKLPTPTKAFPKSASNFLSVRKSRITKYIETRKTGTGKEYANEFRSNLSKSIRFGGSGKSLKSVMKGRLRKFKTAIEKGTFKEIKKRTRAYPLIFKK